MENFQISDAAGLLGVAIYLASYAALQMGFVRGQGYAYASLNCAAASLVLVSMINAFNLSSAVIQVSWIVISIIGLVRFYILSHRARFSDEERELLQDAFPTLDKVHARRLLDLGSWNTGEPNSVLTETGIPVPYLVYLTTGAADVLVSGQQVAVIREKSFIGDMTALSGDPATATVILSVPSRYFAIPAAPLRYALKRDEDFRRGIDSVLSSSVRDKLIRSNQTRSTREVLRPSQ
jgi:CRP-like cAMP-binding protein